MPPEGSSLSAEFVLDSYAVIAYLEAEAGGSRVKEHLESARDGRCRLYLCLVNLGEVLYAAERHRGSSHAQATLTHVDELPISVVAVDRALTVAAAHLKARFPIAYADCFALALSWMRNATLITGDPEFRKVEKDTGLRIEWLPVRR